MRGFYSDKQRKAMFASMSNRFSMYPSDNVLSTPPKYVYDDVYVESDFSKAPVKSEPYFYPDPQLGEDDKRNLEVLRKGGVVYVSPPDSAEEFKRYEDEMRKKLDKKKFAVDEKKLKQANLNGELLDDEVFKQAMDRLGYAVDDVDGDRQGDIRRNVVDEMNKIKKEREFGQVQTYFGDSYKPGRRVKKSDFARKSPLDVRTLNKERVELMAEINNATDLSRERRSEIVKRLDHINDMLDEAGVR